MGRDNENSPSDPLPWPSPASDAEWGTGTPLRVLGAPVDVPAAFATLPVAGAVASVFGLPVPVPVIVGAAWVALVGGVASAVWLWATTPDSTEFTNTTTEGDSQ